MHLDSPPPNDHDFRAVMNRKNIVALTVGFLVVVVGVVVVFATPISPFDLWGQLGGMNYPTPTHGACCSMAGACVEVRKIDCLAGPTNVWKGGSCTSGPCRGVGTMCTPATKDVANKGYGYQPATGLNAKQKAVGGAKNRAMTAFKKCEMAKANADLSCSAACPRGGTLSCKPKGTPNCEYPQSEIDLTTLEELVPARPVENPRNVNGTWEAAVLCTGMCTCMRSCAP